ncbi:MAG: RecX family transcriptional regulator [Lewinellaceae bacterium]|nr:RecX family transcriptional regulator [Saprospiraceae bacterium]MCB9338115.1 RecX family transcriptional regulator [Lewinellaceae bacterium]
MPALAFLKTSPTSIVEQKKPPKKYTSKADALVKLQRYCAYQERCHQEVRSKLLELGVFGDDLENIVAQLIEDNFLNEERYARTFARGKFRMKQWGRNRIIQELKLRGIPDYCIRKAMEEIGKGEYAEALENLLAKKAGMIAGENDFEINGKLAQYAIHRGFEVETVWEAIHKMKRTP